MSDYLNHVGSIYSKDFNCNHDQLITIMVMTMTRLKRGNTAVASVHVQLLKLQSSRCFMILTSDDKNHICNYNNDDDDDVGAG